jgi:hypothetical protein
MAVEGHVVAGLPSHREQLPPAGGNRSSLKEGDEAVERMRQVHDKRDISDPIDVLGFLLLDTPRSVCRDAGDSNDGGDLHISDGVHPLEFLFLGDRGIPAPEPDGCGPEPPEGTLLDCVYPIEMCP